VTRTVGGDIDVLRAGVAGTVLLPGDAGYDDARSVWNGAIDKRPALIMRCAGPDDVAAGLRYAQESGLEVAVRGGGHGYWGPPFPRAG
jgi:FAD/FMN-containing dehydrogenase